MTVSLKNKIIAITGATGTIGAEIAKACAVQGATIILIGRKQKKLEALYDQIIALDAPEPAILILDFAHAKPEDFFNVAETILQSFGRLDALVHTATQLANLTPLAHTSPEKWRLSMHVSLDAIFYLTQACLPLLDNASEIANVIFFHHNEVSKGKAYWGSYAVAKAGLNALMTIFSEEYEAQAQIYFNGFDPICVNSALQYSIKPNGTPDAFNASDVAQKIITLIKNSNKINGEILTMC